MEADRLSLKREIWKGSSPCGRSSGALKTRDFCLEAMHVTDADRLKRLLALVVPEFC
jgi:hypothetical protein